MHVDSIIADGPASRSGLKAAEFNKRGSLISAGDFITHINDDRIETKTQLLTALEKYKEGDTIPVRVIRSPKLNPDVAQVLDFEVKL